MAFKSLTENGFCILRTSADLDLWEKAVNLFPCVQPLLISNILKLEKERINKEFSWYGTTCVEVHAYKRHCRIQRGCHVFGEFRDAPLILTINFFLRRGIFRYRMHGKIQRLDVPAGCVLVHIAPMETCIKLSTAVVVCRGVSRTFAIQQRIRYETIHLPYMNIKKRKKILKKQKIAERYSLGIFEETKRCTLGAIYKAPAFFILPGESVMTAHFMD